MHGASLNDQLEGWRILEERLAKLNLREEAEVDHAVRFPEQRSVYDSKVIPTATEVAFAQCTARCTDEDIDKILNWIHDKNFNKGDL